LLTTSQALGQSSIFLSTHLPHARLQNWPSTAGAALSLLDEASGEDGDDDGEGAAICSQAVLELDPRLEVLHEGAQSTSRETTLLNKRKLMNQAGNYTRFLLLERDDPPLPLRSPPAGSTSIFALSDPEALSRIVGKVISIHSRPASAPPDDDSRFPTRTLVEVEFATTLRPDDPRLRFGEEGAVRYLGSCDFRMESV